MPTALHPQAKFDPIPPDLDLNDLVDRTPNLRWVQRVSRNQIRSLGQQEFEKVVLLHVILGGKPLVVEGWDAVLPQGLFNKDWLARTCDKKAENVRDLVTSADILMTTGHYLRSMETLTNRMTPDKFRDPERQRLYLKDIDCPPEWLEALKKVIHPSLFYLNDNVSGTTSSNDDDVFQSEALAAPAGDLMSTLPEDMRAQNLMCYIGHEGTYTPAHREMCASLGQNIMVEASDGTQPNEKPGSSIWFMTESKDRDVVREYFLSMLGHDIEIEKHFAQINAWKKAPFDVYVVDQRPGDFILIPPLAAHQVWNRGTRTMKVAWNRTTPETLEMALHEALPKARLVCRDEQYKNKAIIYFALQKYYSQLETLEENAEMTQMSFMGLGQDIVKNSPRAKQLAGDFKKLLNLFTEILVDEMFAYKEKDVEFLEFDSCVTCSYCRSNIFNRFLTCKSCIRPLVDGSMDTYDVCMECYAMGRSCLCLSGLKWCEQWSWIDLVRDYEDWRAMVMKNDGFIDLDSSPQPLEIARQRAGKTSVAQICQDALRRRPRKDITKAEREKTPPSESEPDAGEGGPKRKKKKRRREKKGEVRRCHVCCHKDYSYRVHMCTNPGCNEGYCYGVLYRAFDMMPQKVLEDEQWQCPKCQGICNCGACRRSGNTNPYTPKNTSLGHDTRPIADDRSVEALVDFRVHNLSWLKAAGEDGRSKDSRRMQRLREQANSAKAQDLTEQEEATRAMQTNDDNASPDRPVSNGKVHANGEGSHSELHDHLDNDHEHHQLEHLRAAFEAEDGHTEHTLEEDIDTSLYPDPALLASNRIGMGYYEQDDTPDKILFDPYQAPTEEALQADIAEPPEFIKKSIRAAKRKARRENEDPDFIVRRNHHKKARTKGSHTIDEDQNDFLDSMDPALFNQEASAPNGDVSESVMEATPEVPRNPQPSGTGNAEFEEREQMVNGQRLYPANEPALRHARPRVSYADIDDTELNRHDEDDFVVPRPRANASHARLGEDEPPEGATVQHRDHQITSDQAPKRRGRPPKSGSVALNKAATEVSAEQFIAPGPSSEVITTTRSGRAVRHSMPNLAGFDSDSDKKKRREGQTTPKKRGRPRLSGVTTIAAASASRVRDDEAYVGTAQDVSESVRRPRGRPRKSAVVETAEPPRAVPELGTQFLSMAERMAMKGKKFKIAKRKSTGTVFPGASQVSKSASTKTFGRTKEAETEPGPAAAASSLPSGRTASKSIDEEWDDSVPEGVERSHDASSRGSLVGEAHQRPTTHAGRTIVRIADIEGSSSASEAAGSDGSSSDDNDIPARPHEATARNGGRGRGRGRSRGRRRG